MVSYLDQVFGPDLCSSVTMDTKLSSDLVFLILQFLNENRLSETARRLEQESRCYFNMQYFESQVLAGEWDKADCYLSSFITVEENSHSTKTIFEIRKQKYLEALDKKDYARAVEILRKDLKVFEHFNSNIYKELADLIPLGNIRENEQLSNYGDTTSQRQLAFLDLQMFIRGNPQICNKLKFPHIDTSRLWILINQSLNWQHQQCKIPSSIPDIKTLFSDHICAPLGGSQNHTSNSIVGESQQCLPYFPVPTHASFPKGVDLSGRCRLSLTGWMANSEPSIPHPPVPGGTGNAFPPQNGGFLKQIRTGTANITGSDYQFVSPVHVMKCSCIGPSDVNNADSKRPTDAKQNVRDKEANKIKKLCLENVSHPIHCKTSKLQGISKGKIVQILVTNSGSSLLALDSNACCQRWDWGCNEGNPTGKVTVTISTGLPLESASHSTTHDSYCKDPEKQIPCMVVSNNDEYIISTFGREVSLRKLQTFEFVSVFLLPSPPATSFALHPEDNNIIAFGLENSKILILHVKNGTSKMLEGHHRKEITCVAFSICLDLLISAGADGLWQPQDPLPAPISSAQYSCDSQLVYVSFCDCAIGVFDADVLRPLFNITPAFFLSGMRRNNIYPLAIAAHPQVYNELVIGFSDGEVHLIEVVESQGEEIVGSLKNGEGSSDPSTSNHGSELPK